MTAYYNEFDPYAAQWLRNLIAAGHIAPGDVDERSIADVRPSDLIGYTQCHFFAGIGVWSYALRNAGWSDDRPVWTGSCPCQPFSAAGKGGGFDDERHLWPHFHWLISQCRPPVVFGEQVASKDGLAWLDLVQADLEGTGYAAGAVDLCAAGVGAPHIRQRLWWVGERLAERFSLGREGLLGESDPRLDQRNDEQRAQPRPRFSGEVGELADTDDAGPQRGHGGHAYSCGREETARHTGPLRLAGGLEYAASDGRHERRAEPSGRGFAGGCGLGGLANATRSRRYAGVGHTGAARNELHDERGGETGRLADADGGHASAERQQRGGEQRQQPQDSGAGRLANPGDGAGQRSEPRSTIWRSAPEARRDVSCGPPGPTNGFWRAADWLFCRDGKWRPVEPGTFPLAHGATARVGRLRGYGNAIVAQAAQAFIEAYLDARHPAVDLRLTDDEGIFG